MTDPIADLRARVAEARQALTGELMQQRMLLLDQRVALEERAPQLADRHEVDLPVVFATITAAWRVHTERIDQVGAPSPATVEATVAAVLTALGDGTAEELTAEEARAFDQVVAARGAGSSVRQTLLDAGRLVTAMGAAKNRQ
jgi:hypothetical protein